MIEVYVPFLLILMSWYPADPQSSMQVQQRLFLSIGECETVGADIAQRLEEEPDNGRAFAWKCVQQEQHIEVVRPLQDGS